MCAVEGCQRKVWARRLCRMHYKRLLATGDPEGKKLSGPAPRPPADLFWAKVVKTETCWLWTGAKASKYGHGSFMHQKRNFKAHRWAYESLVGPIPEGLTLDLSLIHI